MNTKTLKIRVVFLFSVFLLYFSFISFRLVQLQVIKDDSLEILAQKQFQTRVQKAPFRRSLVDRRGEELAVSVAANSVYARPLIIRNKRKVARALSKMLGSSSERWLQKLSSDKPFVWVQRQVQESRIKPLMQLKLSGIFIEPENKRFYPNGMLAANLLGFTGIDGNGLAGLELFFEDRLLTKGALYRFTRDGRGNPSYIEPKENEPISEPSYTLTLDRRIQSILEEELDHALIESGAKAVMAIVLDPQNGEILAMGQRPSFDPNQFVRYSKDLYANRMTSYLYEPGSTIKVLLAAEAIEQGLLNEQSPIDCGNGSIKIGEKTIREAESDHKFGILPLSQAIKVSSNIGAVRIAQKLGVKGVRNALEKFGLTRKTGIEFPGEATSQSKGDSTWVPIFLATVGFGQGIAVTPLQMVNAFALLANGGYRVRPTLIPQAKQSEEERERTRVFSPKTIDTIRRILYSVTEKGGTGHRAHVPGYSVAGKTGTAQKYDSNGGYDNKKYFSSFIGFLPVENPELLIGVMVDEPRWPYYGSQVAAPVFQRIAERTIQLSERALRVALSNETENKERKIGIKSDTPTYSIKATEGGKLIMPDLMGLSMRTTIHSIGKSFDNITILGSGYLKKQEPKSGTEITRDIPIILQFEETS